MKKLAIFSLLCCSLLRNAAAEETCGGADYDDGVNDQVTYEGQCDGDDAIFCSAQDAEATADSELIRYNCDDFLEESNPGTVVAYLHHGRRLGFLVCFPFRYGLRFSTSSGDNVYFVCGDANGADSNLYCDVSSGTCASGTGSCTPPAQGQAYTPTCDGNTLMTSCLPWNQHLGLNCVDPQVGATSCSNGACVGIPAGGQCDGTYFVCADGLGVQRRKQHRDGNLWYRKHGPVPAPAPAREPAREPTPAPARTPTPAPRAPTTPKNQRPPAASAAKQPARATSHWPVCWL